VVGIPVTSTAAVPESAAVVNAAVMWLPTKILLVKLAWFTTSNSPFIAAPLVRP